MNQDGNEAMRYGTLPIVHETGGLRDTVEPYNAFTGSGTGFSFYQFDGHTMLQTIYNALDVYYNQPEAWNKLVQQAMRRDFSWTIPAQDYLALYRESFTHAKRRVRGIWQKQFIIQHWLVSKRFRQPALPF